MLASPRCCSQITFFSQCAHSLQWLLHSSFPEHADNCIFSCLPDFSSDLLQHLDLSMSKAKHIIRCSPDLKPLFLLHFLSWIMTLSSTWLPKQSSLVSCLTSLPKLCLFCLLFYLSVLFTYFPNYRSRPCHCCFLPGLP